MDRPWQRIFACIFIWLLSAFAQAVDGQIEQITTEDTARVNTLLREGSAVYRRNPDSAIYFYRLIIENPRVDLNKITPDLSPLGKAYIETVIRALNYTGNIYYFDDQYNRSEGFFQRSYELSVTAGLKDYTARALFDLGYNHYKINDFDGAEKKFRESGTLYQKIGNQAELFGVVNALGLTYRRLGHYGKADSSFRQAMQIATSLNDSNLLADVWLNNGILLCEQGNLEEGIAFFEQALDHYQQTGDRKATSLALLNIGVVMKIVGEYNKALYYIRESTAIEELLQQKSQIVVRYYNLADLYLDMGDRIKAAEYCHKIQVVHKEIGSRPFEAECDFLFGKYHYLGGDFSSAEQYFTSASALTVSSGDMPLIANIRLWHARTEMRRGRVVEAIKLARDAYEIASALQLILNQKEASQLLSEAYEKAGDEKEALSWFKTYLTHADNLSYFNKQKEIRRIEAKYNYEQKEKENELLRNRTILQEEKLRSRNITTLALVIGVLLSFIIIFLLIRRNKDARLLFEQQQMLNLKHLEEIENELDGKKRELTSKMMFLNQKNEMISRLIKRLQELQDNSDNSSEELLSIVNELRTDVPQSSWKEFEAQFTQVHPGFYQRLYERHPELTSYEQRLCAFLRMNLNTKEISSITGRSPKSIEVTRSRIRTKLQLKRDENLSSFLAAI